MLHIFVYRGEVIAILDDQNTILEPEKRLKEGKEYTVEYIPHKINWLKPKLWKPGKK